MPETSVLMFDEGFDQCGGIRCRFISEWFRVDSYVPSKESLLKEVEKIRPDVVVMDLDLYAKIDGIKTSWQIRNRFNIPVMYTSGHLLSQYWLWSTQYRVLGTQLLRFLIYNIINITIVTKQEL
jgi:DNA-binding NarL/FixJ family response regulator